MIIITNAINFKLTCAANQNTFKKRSLSCDIDIPGTPVAAQVTTDNGFKTPTKKLIIETNTKTPPEAAPSSESLASRTPKDNHCDFMSMLAPDGTSPVMPPLIIDSRITAATGLAAASVLSPKTPTEPTPTQSVFHRPPIYFSPNRTGEVWFFTPKDGTCTDGSPIIYDFENKKWDRWFFPVPIENAKDQETTLLLGIERRKIWGNPFRINKPITDDNPRTVITPKTRFLRHGWWVIHDTNLYTSEELRTGLPT